MARRRVAFRTARLGMREIQRRETPLDYHAYGLAVRALLRQRCGTVRVLRAPGGEFDTGSSFGLEHFVATLWQGNWPEGMLVLTRRKRIYAVSGWQGGPQWLGPVKRGQLALDKRCTLLLRAA